VKSQQVHAVQQQHVDFNAPIPEHDEEDVDEEEREFHGSGEQWEHDFRVEPIGRSGEMLYCYTCGSENHLQSDCPVQEIARKAAQKALAEMGLAKETELVNASKAKRGLGDGGRGGRGSVDGSFRGRGRGFGRGGGRGGRPTGPWQDNRHAQRSVHVVNIEEEEKYDVAEREVVRSVAPTMLDAGAVEYVPSPSQTKLDATPPAWAEEMVSSWSVTQQQIQQQLEQVQNAQRETERTTKRREVAQEKCDDRQKELEPRRGFTRENDRSADKRGTETNRLRPCSKR
jgi:hypothetical protein